MTVQMTGIKSSAIRSIGYDEQAKELHVNWISGGHSIYSNVTPEQYKSLMGAPSKGLALHQRIVGKREHPHRKARA